MKRFLLAYTPFLLALALSACNKPLKGEFGWSSVDDRGVEEPELSLLIEDQFQYGRDDLYFYSYETVWWIYQIQEGSFQDAGFMASLYRENKTPDPLEIDMRHVSVTRTGFREGVIRQKYDPLQTGDYILKIAYNSSVVDQVEFHIVPPGGTHAIDNYYDGDMGEDIPEESRDDLKYYSRPLPPL